MVGLEPDEVARKTDGEAAEWTNPADGNRNWPASNYHL